MKRGAGEVEADSDGQQPDAGDSKKLKSTPSTGNRKKRNSLPSSMVDDVINTVASQGSVNGPSQQPATSLPVSQTIDGLQVHFDCEFSQVKKQLNSLHSLLQKLTIRINKMSDTLCGVLSDDSNHAKNQDNPASTSCNVVTTGTSKPSVSVSIAPSGGPAGLSETTGTSAASLVLDRQATRQLVSAVYVDLNARSQRTNSFIITGYPDDSPTDCSQITSFLYLHFSRYLPGSFVVRSCKRLGKKMASKVQPLLVTLEHSEHAQWFINNAKLLRQADSSFVQDNIFISAYLTRAEAKAAYDIRCKRRASRVGKESSQGTSGRVFYRSSSEMPTEISSPPAFCDLFPQAPLPRLQWTQRQTGNNVIVAETIPDLGSFEHFPSLPNHPDFDDGSIMGSVAAWQAEDGLAPVVAAVTPCMPSTAVRTGSVVAVHTPAPPTPVHVVTSASNGGQHCAAKSLVVASASSTRSLVAGRSTVAVTSVNTVASASAAHNARVSVPVATAVATTSSTVVTAHLHDITQNVVAAAAVVTVDPASSVQSGLSTGAKPVVPATSIGSTPAVHAAAAPAAGTATPELDMFVAAAEPQTAAATVTTAPAAATSVAAPVSCMLAAAAGSRSSAPTCAVTPGPSMQGTSSSAGARTEYMDTGPSD